MRLPILLSIVLTSAAVSAMAQSAVPPPEVPAAKAPFVKVEAEDVVRELASRLEQDFVFPEVGKRYAAMLRANLAAGKYSSFADAHEFAETVTKDLQAVHEDRHLRLQPPKLGGDGRKLERRGPPRALNAISKSGWLADGVAYVRFEGFPGNETTLAAVRDFLAKHKDANTLIIDARSHGGGGLAEMDVLFPALFEKPTVLVGMDTRLAVAEREGEMEEQEASVRPVPGPAGVFRQEHYVEPAALRTGLADAKVFLLTSDRTASAGEHLALSLKRTKRATLIGETTRGAGHYGGSVDLGHGYAAFIPMGRTFDPDTGQGWEAVGVEPHVAVPADKALDEALKLAGVDKSAEVALAQLK